MADKYCQPADQSLFKGRRACIERDVSDLEARGHQQLSYPSQTVAFSLDSGLNLLTLR